MSSSETKEIKESKVLNYFLLDYDGCLREHPHSNVSKTLDISEKINTYQKSQQDKKQGLLCYLGEFTDSERQIGVGSNRQSLRRDVENFRADTRTTKLDSCFHTIQKLGENWNIPVNPFLMGDIQDRKESGKSFAEAIANSLYTTITTDTEITDAESKTRSKKLKSTIDNDKTGAPQETPNRFILTDASKISLIYAQIHHIASQEENHDKKITVHFLDDKIEILNKITAFYQKNPDLIPNNVTLKVCHYSPDPDKVKTPEDAPGETVTEKSNIQGTGTVNKNFRNTVRAVDHTLVTQDLDDTEYPNGQMNQWYGESYFDPTQLNTNYKQNRDDFETQFRKQHNRDAALTTTIGIQASIESIIQKVEATADQKATQSRESQPSFWARYPRVTNVGLATAGATVTTGLAAAIISGVSFFMSDDPTNKAKAAAYLKSVIEPGLMNISPRLEAATIVIGCVIALTILFLMAHTLWKCAKNVAPNDSLDSKPLLPQR